MCVVVGRAMYKKKRKLSISESYNLLCALSLILSSRIFIYILLESKACAFFMCACACTKYYRINYNIKHVFNVITCL